MDVVIIIVVGFGRPSNPIPVIRSTFQVKEFNSSTFVAERWGEMPNEKEVKEESPRNGKLTYKNLGMVKQRKTKKHLIYEIIRKNIKKLLSGTPCC